MSPSRESPGRRALLRERVADVSARRRALDDRVLRDVEGDALETSEVAARPPRCTTFVRISSSRAHLADDPFEAIWSEMDRRVRARCREAWAPAAGACRAIDRPAAVRVHLEVEVRLDPVRVARVADEADELARRGRARPCLSPGRHETPFLHPPWLSFARPEVVVQVDVPVGRAASAVQGRACSRTRRPGFSTRPASTATAGVHGASAHDVVPLVAPRGRGSPKSFV